MAKVTDKTASDIETAQHDIGDDYEEQQVGFPPYWKPSVGARMKVRFMARDDRDPEFIRYIFQNCGGAPIQCFVGPEAKEKVYVKDGEYFSMSQYAVLENEIGHYHGLQDPIVLEVKGTRKNSDPKKNDMFVFGIRVSNRDVKLLNSKRGEHAKLLGAPAAS